MDSDNGEYIQIDIIQSQFYIYSPSQDTDILLHQVHSFLDTGSNKIKKQSLFKLRTEESSASQYFHFYGNLAHQQNMLQVL